MSLRHIPASQRLPHDVLWYLFGYVFLSDPSKGPVAASQVSQHWRLAALLSPFIWSHITIRLYTSSQQHLLALAHFERSRKVPITLTIHATRHLKSWEKDTLLLPYAHRFRSLHVKASAGSLANLLWAAIDMPMPRLEAFETAITNASCLAVNRKIIAIDENVNVIPPIFHHHLVDWGSWNTTGLTALTLDTTHLWNKPDLDDIYRALANTSHTLQRFEFQGFAPDIADDELAIWLPLEFPALRSLTVICHDDIVPLLQLMSIPALDSLTLRDFIICPTSTTVTDPMDIDESFSFDPDGLLQTIKQWTSITRLEIFGIDDLPSDDESGLLDYIKSLNQLSSLVLYGIGTATLIAHTLFMHDPTEAPLLPKLSHFLLAIIEVMPNNDVCNYLIARQHHTLPRLQRLTINLDCLQYLDKLDRIDFARDGCDNFFVLFEGPIVGKYKPIEEIIVPEFFPNANEILEV